MKRATKERASSFRVVGRASKVDNLGLSCGYNDLGPVWPVDNYVYNSGRNRLSVCAIAVRPWCAPGALPVAERVVFGDSLCAGMVCAIAVVFT